MLLENKTAVIFGAGGAVGSQGVAMKRYAVSLLLLLLWQGHVYGEPVSRLEDQVVAQIKDFESVDIRERRVSTSDLRGKIIVMGFSTQKTSDALIEWQTKIGYETGITLKGYDEIFVISVADVSRYPRVIKPIVRKRVVRTYEKSNKRLFQRFEEHRTDPPKDLGDRIYLIPDWSGEIVERFGIREQMDQPHLFIIGRDGAIVGHFVQDTEDSNLRILTQVRDLLQHRIP